MKEWLCLGTCRRRSEQMATCRTGSIKGRIRAVVVGAFLKCHKQLWKFIFKGTPHWHPSFENQILPAFSLKMALKSLQLAASFFVLCSYLFTICRRRTIEENTVLIKINNCARDKQKLPCVFSHVLSKSGIYRAVVWSILWTSWHDCCTEIVVGVSLKPSGCLILKGQIFSVFLSLGCDFNI